MQYNEKLDAELKALEGDMIETLQRWIRVPSVRAERSAENAPFGADVRRALDTAMADLKRLGMEPRDVDGYCCDTEIGEGDEVIAVLAIWTSCRKAMAGITIPTARKSSTVA